MQPHSKKIQLPKFPQECLEISDLPTICDALGLSPHQAGMANKNEYFKKTFAIYIYIYISKNTVTLW